MTITSILAYVGIGIWAFVAFLTLIGAFKGRQRGFLRQLVRTITIAASVVISIYVTDFAYGFVSNWLTSQTSAGLVSTVEGFGIALGDFGAILTNFSTESMNHVLAIPMSLIVLPLVFVVAFIVINTVLRIVHAIICKIFGLAKWRNNFLTRFFGFILGAVQGFAVAIICLVPIIGLSTAVSTAVKDMQTEAPTAQSTAEVTKTYNTYFKPYAEDPSIVILGKLGGNMLYEKLTKIEVNGTEHEMHKEVVGPTLKTYSAITELGSLDWQYLSKENKAAIDTLIEVANESPYMATLIADILDSLSTAFTNGTIASENEGLVKEFTDALLGVFVGINEQELVPTLEVIRDVFFTLSDERVLLSLTGDTALISDILAKKDESGKTLIVRLTDRLNSNDRTDDLVSTMTRISIEVMADSFETVDGVEITAETYDKVKVGVSEVISINKKNYATEEKYVAAISDSLNSTFEENGILLEKDVVDGMAQHVADNYSDAENLSDAEINDIILSYYNSYLETGAAPQTSVQ